MISLENARCFIHAHGNLWERALWDYLFDGGSAERVQKILSGYKNSDGGFGHGLEHDIKAPMSNPLMLEFLLTVMRDTGLPPGSLLDGTPEWVAIIQNEDGSLQNPPESGGLSPGPVVGGWSGQTGFHHGQSYQTENMSPSGPPKNQGLGAEKSHPGRYPIQQLAFYGLSCL